jgi:hypothetical protein
VDNEYTSFVDVTVSTERYSRECPSNFRRMISLISLAVTFLGEIIALSHNY